MKKSVPLPRTLQEFLQSEYLTPKTSEVLTERLHRNFEKPLYFTAAEFTLLGTVCQLLMGEETDLYNNKMAGHIDERLAQGKSDGWRYDEMPPDGEMYRLGLEAINGSGRLLYNADFLNLNTAAQTEVLTEIQNGTAPGEIWKDLSPTLFFEELLAEIAETYYSFPEIQIEIGYAGMADRFGWEKPEMGTVEPAERAIVSLKEIQP